MNLNNPFHDKPINIYQADHLQIFNPKIVHYRCLFSIYFKKQHDKKKIANIHFALDCRFPTGYVLKNQRLTQPRRILDKYLNIIPITLLIR